MADEVQISGNVYGGGNAADVAGNTTVNIGTASTNAVEDIHTSGNVYGGGNKADVTGKTSVKIGGNP